MAPRNEAPARVERSRPGTPVGGLNLANLGAQAIGETQTRIAGQQAQEGAAQGTRVRGQQAELDLGARLEAERMAAAAALANQEREYARVLQERQSGFDREMDQENFAFSLGQMMDDTAQQYAIDQALAAQSAQEEQVSFGRLSVDPARARQLEQQNPGLAQGIRDYQPTGGPIGALRQGLATAQIGGSVQDTMSKYLGTQAEQQQLAQYYVTLGLDPETAAMAASQSLYDYGVNPSNELDILSRLPGPPAGG